MASITETLQHGTSISDCINSARSVIVTQNQHYLKIIMQIFLFCSKQEIALCGHREGSDSLQLISQHDPIIQQRLVGRPKNTTYMSPEVQNLLLHIMATTVQEKICSFAKKADIYSVLADEIKDCSKRETAFHCHQVC